jgi:hypothetical protein
VTEQNRTILQWVLGIGILVGGAKVVMDMTKGSPSPPAVADTPKTKTTSSDSAAADPLLPPVGPAGPGEPRKPTPMPGTGAAPQDNPLQQMQQVLADIAKDPVGANPQVTQKDPENGLILYGFEIKGLTQPVLAVIEGKPEAWAWSFAANIPPELFAPQGKTEPAKSPGQGAQAIKLLEGPLAGVVVITVDEQPRVRVLKSVGFQAFENAAEAAASASGAPSGKAPPGGGGRKPH